MRGCSLCRKQPFQNSSANVPREEIKCARVSSAFDSSNHSLKLFLWLSRIVFNQFGVVVTHTPRTRDVFTRRPAKSLLFTCFFSTLTNLIDILLGLYSTMFSCWVLHWEGCGESCGQSCVTYRVKSGAPLDVSDRRFYSS